MQNGCCAVGKCVTTKESERPRDNILHLKKACARIHENQAYWVIKTEDKLSSKLLQYDTSCSVLQKGNHSDQFLSENTSIMQMVINQTHHNCHFDATSGRHIPAEEESNHDEQPEWWCELNSDGQYSHDLISDHAHVNHTEK